MFLWWDIQTAGNPLCLELRSLSNDSTIDSANQLFTTLDTVSRRINYHDLTGSFLLSDTVGFIRKLPTALIAAFRATLEEVVAANLLLVVLDVSEDEAIDHFDIVLDTLKELQADTIPRIVVLNKIDIAGDNTDMIEMELRASGEEAVRVSALAREGFISLLERIQYKLEEQSLE